MRPDHWDLMFEIAGQLRTWSIPQTPRPGVTVMAELLADHRLAYLDYEGPVSGNRGSVSRVDRGTYNVLQEGDGAWKLSLYGAILMCELQLTRCDPIHWRAEFSS